MRPGWPTREAGPRPGPPGGELRRGGGGPARAPRSTPRPGRTHGPRLPLSCTCCAVIRGNSTTASGEERADLLRKLASRVRVPNALLPLAQQRLGSFFRAVDWPNAQRLSGSTKNTIVRSMAVKNTYKIGKSPCIVLEFCFFQTFVDRLVQMTNPFRDAWLTVQC